MHKLYRPVPPMIGAVSGVALAAFTLSGCAAQMLSNARIADNTAGILGVAPSEVTISDRREVFPNTYYSARVRGASYACTINGGNALSFSMINTPSCTAQEVGGAPGRSHGRQARRG